MAGEMPAPWNEHRARIIKIHFCRADRIENDGKNECRRFHG